MKTNLASIFLIMLIIALLFVTMRYINQISNKPNSEIKER